MKAETPALGISKVREYEDMIVYNINCQCTDPNHYHLLTVEADQETNDISVIVDLETTTDYWTEYVNQNSNLSNDHLYHLKWTFAYIINETIRRVKIASRAIFYGHIQRQATLILNRQQALNYAEALKNAISNLKEKNETQRSDS